jgi:hypothetical protein
MSGLGDRHRDAQIERRFQGDSDVLGGDPQLEVRIVEIASEEQGPDVGIGPGGAAVYDLQH